MSVNDADAYSPAQMAARVENAGITKGNLDALSTLILAMLAGAFIAFGAMLFTLVTHDSNLSAGLTRIVGGLVFCLGLILVIIAGAELFTGNNLIVMAYVSRKITGTQLLRNWAIVFVGNAIGAFLIVLMVYMSGHLETGNGALALHALNIANAKVNLDFTQALVRGILCNILVCLAVWLCFSGRSVTDKILAIIFPITAFVALGFEHSVANMYFVPVGMVINQDPVLIQQIQQLTGSLPDTAQLDMTGFLYRNLLPVTIGNIIGGGILVGLVYWFVYLRPAAAEPIRRLMTDGPPAVSADTSVANAVKIMQENNSSSVLVGVRGEFEGIVAESDIVRKVTANGLDVTRVTTGEIMSTPLVCVDVKTPVYNVYRTLADNRIRHVVVTDAGRQIGFISVKDLLRRPLI